MSEQWIIDITKKLQLSDLPDQEWNTKSIYQVPKILINADKSKAYEPKLASFGPYHHGSSYLQPMEKHKERAVIQYLHRIAKASKTLNDVLIAMRNVESRLLAFYDGLDADEEDSLEGGSQRRRRDKFVELMIVDGCFALEIMLAQKRYVGDEHSDYNLDDPIFGAVTNGYYLDLKRDMLLLENQIPLQVLSILADIDGSGIEDVMDLIRIFCNLPPSSLENQMLKDRCFHILDFYRKIMIVEGKYLPSDDKNVQSATKLKNAGISFCKSKSKSFKDIYFDSNGILSLPSLEITDSTESLLLNFMAFERLHTTAGNEVTAYVCFMDGLIDTTDDVALLRNKEIILWWGGSEDEIANMFNRITKAMILVTYDVDIEEDVNKKLNDYCQKRMHRWRASFMHTYFKNPWVFISLLGGLFLLTLTMLQSVYTILQYYSQK